MRSNLNSFSFNYSLIPPQVLKDEIQSSEIVTVQLDAISCPVVMQDGSTTQGTIDVALPKPTRGHIAHIQSQKPPIE